MGKKQEFETTKCIILVLHVKIEKKNHECACAHCLSVKHSKMEKA